ncbi:MAG: hypothetical protein QOJ73_139 [Streptosporangiaceae bacterium]|jgi:hypothetical protein|nr:hypothetical protein [Streptosporangiaceae bacterium]
MAQRGQAVQTGGLRTGRFLGTVPAKLTQRGTHLTERRGAAPATRGNVAGLAEL